MNTTLDNPVTTTIPVSAPANADPSRCPFIYSNGKRCRLPGLSAHHGFCLGHSKHGTPIPLPANSFEDSEDLSPDLLPQLSEFDSALDVKLFLARLLVLVTKGRVSPRRASVLAYITNQLLHSHHAIDREKVSQSGDEPQVIIDIPGPRRDDPIPPSHPIMDWLTPATNVPNSKESSCPR
jgi:hypothetical protein